MSRYFTIVGLGVVLLVLAAAVPTAAAQVPATVQVADNPTLGKILTDSAGMTLYLFTPDQENVSVCYDKCATAWPPLLVKDGSPQAGPGVTGLLATTQRKDGTMQVTYNGIPLYYWVKDAKPGDVTGQGVQDVWFVVHPDVASMTIANPVVQVSTDPNLGDILTNQGMTLYWYRNDTANASTSTCTDQCAVNWPALLVKDGSPQAGKGVTGPLGVIDRQDGTKQVTYNGMPLYFFVKDVRPGDTNGHGVKDVWFAVHPDVAAMATANPLVQVSTDPKLGDILTNQGMTLYWFKNDTTNTSTCTDQCAVNWPPLLVKDGSPQAGQGVTGTLGVIDRQDGTKQVTYNGMPLYFFVQDLRPGDTNGQGIKGVWSVVAPAGSTADVGAATPMPSTQSSANKW